MRRTVLILIMAFLAMGGAVCRSEIGRLHTGVTLFDEDQIVANFSSMGNAFHTADLPRGDGSIVAAANKE